MEPQPTMDLLPVLIFVVACLIAAVFVIIGVRRNARRDKGSDSQ
jgi:hypothetical protein